jgi:hypothetical protein
MSGLCWNAEGYKHEYGVCGNTVWISRIIAFIKER